MKRRAITGGLAVMVLVGVLVTTGSRTITTTWADPSSVSWDIYMEDPEHNEPDDPEPCKSNNDNNGIIEPDECPDVTSTFWLQPEGGPGGSQSFFDLANVIWTTGPYDDPTPIDHTGDTILDPGDGLVVNRPTAVGVAVGEISMEVNSNMLPGELLQNNIDDVGVAMDPKATGQPTACGGDTNGDTTIDTLTLKDRFALWNAIVDASQGTVSASESQSPDPTYPPDCDGTQGKACAPKGVTRLPVPILAIETAIGLPQGSAVSRSYGIAKLPLVAGIGSDMDVNFLVYGLHDMGVDAYLNLTLVQYPGLRSPDPSLELYGPLAQTVQICPPYWSSVGVYGVIADPDFDEDGRLDMLVTPEINRLVICSDGSCGPYDYTIRKSTAEDYDGDTIPGYADRCDTDPNSGTATDDIDGDTITGTCETTGAGNGEGNNPRAQDPGGDACGATGSGYKGFYPFAAGQDVDCDGYLNLTDSCPTVADADLNSDAVIDYQQDADGDGVGDVCDGAINIRGDGNGYDGGFVDNPNVCNDRWSTGAEEPKGEDGDIFYKYCLGPGNGLGPTTEPYVNPALAFVRFAAYRDANDDGTPDFWDGLTSACSNDATYCPNADPEPYDFFSVSDEDGDGYSDGCESFQGSDALDASDAPGSIPGSDDCDGDTTSDADEVAAGTNPLDGIESDGDGYCDDAEETGGGLDPTRWYDFFDVPVPARVDPQGNGVRNGAISIGDVLAVLFYAGAANDGVANGNGVDYDSDKNVDGVEDGVDYDRTPTTPPIPPGPPDGAISISDVLAALAQSGAFCDAKGME